MASMNYKDISAIARRRRDAVLSSFFTIPKVEESKLPKDLTSYSLKSGYYTTDEIEIIESEAEDILQKIRDRIWTSLEVTQAFCKAAAMAQELVCLSLLLESVPAAH
jgi:amidase